MNTPESQQIIEIPHPLLARYPRLFQCRRYEVQFYREQIALASGTVESVRDIPIAGKCEITIAWPASQRERITMHSPRTLDEPYAR
jgi:hypothetical protein